MSSVPETFTIECNRSISNLQYPDLNPINSEWKTIINPPIQLRKNDQITISNIFLNERGASSDTISFNTDNTSLSHDSKTRIIFSFYAMNDGTCDKRNGIDISSAPNTISYNNSNTYGFAPLYRRQVYIMKLTQLPPPANTIFDPYRELFFTGIDINTDNKIIPVSTALDVAFEDRFLPGLYYNELTLQPYSKGGLTSDNDTYMYFNAPTEELIFIGILFNEQFDWAARTQPGCVSYLRTKQADIPAANAAHSYIDNYYLCTNKFRIPLADPTNYYNALAFDANSIGSNLYITDNSQTLSLSGQAEVTFPNDPAFVTQIYAGLNVALSLPNPEQYLNPSVTIVSVSNGTPVIINSTTAYNSNNMIGTNIIRIQDTSQISLHITFATDIPAGSVVTKIEPDTFPTTPVELQVVNEVFSGENSLVVPSFMLAELSTNMLIEDITQERLNFINQNVGPGITTFTLNQRKWLTKTTTIDSSAQQNLGLDNFGYIPLPNTNNLSVGQYIDDSSFIQEDTKIKEIIPFQQVTALESKIYGGELNNTRYVDVEPNGITLLHSNDNEPSLYNITSGTLTSVAVDGVANILHVESSGSAIRIHIDRQISIPVSSAGYVQKTLVVPQNTFQTGFTIYLQGKVADYPLHNFLWDNGAANHFQSGTDILFVQSSSTYPGFVRLTLSRDIVTPLGNTGDIANMGFVSEVEINQLDNTSSYILPDKPLLLGISSNQVIPFYSNKLDPTQTVYVGLELISSDITAGTRITQVVNLTDGSDRQAITIDTPTTGGMNEFQQIETVQRAFGGNNFYIDSFSYNPAGNVILNLSNNIPFNMAAHSQISIKREYANQGNIYMDNNFTGNIDEDTAVQFTFSDRLVTLSSNILQNIPAQTKFYFTNMPTNVKDLYPNPPVTPPPAMTLEIFQSFKGYSYDTNNTDLGMMETDGINIGDELYQIAFHRLGKAPATTSISNNATSISTGMTDEIAYVVDSFKPLYTETIGTLEVNENSLLTGYLPAGLVVTPEMVTFSVNLPAGFTPNSTSTLFNIARGGIIMKFENINTNEVEYMRFPNGINNNKVTNATYTVNPNHTLAFSGIIRGQYGTTALDFDFSSTIIKFFTPILQKEQPTGRVGKGYNELDDSNMYSDFDFDVDPVLIYGVTPFLTTQTTTEFFKSFGISINDFYNKTETSKATYIFSNLPKTFQNFGIGVSRYADVLHRSFIDIDMGEQTNLTPTDISNKFNSITQKPVNLRQNYTDEEFEINTEIPNTAGFGINVSASFMNIVGLNISPAINSSAHSYPGFTEPAGGTGGSFFFKCKYANYEDFYGAEFNGEVVIIPRNGKYPVKDATLITGEGAINMTFPREIGFESFMSQMVGCSDFSLNYNTTLSRFEIKTHQIYSTYSDAATSTEGTLATKIFTPYLPEYYNNLNNLPVGLPYQDRFGGINFECWAAPIIEFGLNDPLSSTSTLYDIEDANNLEPVGRKFWNKLGFDDNQLIGNKGSKINDIGLQELLGTSGNKIDVSFSYVPNEVSSNSLNLPNLGLVNYNTNSMYGLVLQHVDTNIPYSNHAVSYNLPSTIGIPFNNDFVAAGTAPYTPFSGTLNPDNVINPGYNIAFTGAITGLTAYKLPSKTTRPYFLLFCEEFSGNNNFYTTFNKGSLQGEAMATISRLYSAMDFFYSYQSPQAFFLKNDMTLSTITNRILNSDMTTPNTIDGNSSVIYQIIRQNPQPIPLPPTIKEQQNEYYQQQAEMEETARKMKQSNGLSAVQNVINQITQAIVSPSDNENELINKILNNAESLNIGKMNSSQLKKEIATNPNMASILNDIQTLQGHTAQFGEPSSPPPLDVFGGFSVYGTPEESPFETPYATPGGITPDTENTTAYSLDPEELSRALNQAKIQESILRGNVEPIQSRIEGLGGRPKTLDFKPIELDTITSTAELSRREQVLEPGETKIYGEGRKQLENARLQLAQSISDKSQRLKGEEPIEQQLPPKEEDKGGGAA